MNLPVWMYWEGPRPEWITWCERTIRAHGADVRLIDRDGFEALYDDDRDVDLTPLCSAHKADFVRAFLLQRYGGLWIDIDCLAVRDLQPWIDRLADYEFLGYKARHRRMANNLMGARPGSAIARDYYARVRGILRSGEPLSWSRTGSMALSDTIRAVPGPWLRLNYELIQPICPFTDPASFFAVRTAADHARHFNARSTCFMLSYSSVRAYADRHPGCSLLQPGTFFRFVHDQALAPPRAPRAMEARVFTPTCQHIPFCAEILAAVHPARVLDARIDTGHWGSLVRAVCDDANGRSRREHWHTWLDGVAGAEEDIQEQDQLFYNMIYVGSALEVIGHAQRPWNLAILTDLTFDVATSDTVVLVRAALDKSDYVVVNIGVTEAAARSAAMDAAALADAAFTPLHATRLRQWWTLDGPGPRGVLLLTRDNPAHLHVS